MVIMGCRLSKKTSKQSQPYEEERLSSRDDIQSQLDEMRNILKQTETELKSVNQSLTKSQDELLQARKKEEELKSINQRLTEMNTLQENELQKVRSALENKEEELKTANKRLTETKESHENGLCYVRQQESAHVDSSPQHCNPQGCEHKESMTEMETFYKKKLEEERSQRLKKEKELKSFKDRLAAQVSASLRTGDTESMNNPVSKTRLTEMYDKLRLLQWPKFKAQLKFSKINSQEAKDLIQKTFGKASDEMKRRKQQIEEMFQQSESSSGPTLQKVKEFRQLTVQNLQMALFHTNKEELLKTGFQECLGEFPEEVKVTLRPLTSECYWLSCLIALNNPPLQPDWKNHVPELDSWDIFPREIKPSVM